MKWQAPAGGDFQRPDPGTYLARCVRLIDLGTQTNDYNGEVSEKRKVLVGWELPTELIPTGDYAGQPFLVMKFYTQSLHEKSNLRHDLQNWRGRDFTEEELQGFDPKNILGAPCLVTLTEGANGRVNVTGVTALPKGTKVGEQFNPSLIFSLDEFDAAVFDGLSDGIKAIIQKSPEFEQVTHGAPTPADDYRDIDFGSDDIPF
jgi:hypothetical protein